MPSARFVLAEHTAILLAQVAFLDLAGAAHGQGVDKNHVIRHPLLGHALGLDPRGRALRGGARVARLSNLSGRATFVL